MRIAAHPDQVSGFVNEWRSIQNSVADDVKSRTSAAGKPIEARDLDRERRPGILLDRQRIERDRSSKREIRYRFQGVTMTSRTTKPAKCWPWLYGTASEGGSRAGPVSRAILV